MKRNIAGIIKSRDDVSLAEAERRFDSFVEAVKESLHQGEKVSLPGIGTLRVVRVAETRRRNPQTGEMMMIAEHDTIRFKVEKPRRART